MKNIMGLLLSISILCCSVAHTSSADSLSDSVKLLIEQWSECLQAKVALFKPAEMDTSLAKMYASAKVLGVPFTKTYLLENKSKNEDSLVVTWSFVGQEDYTAFGFTNLTGKIRINVEIQNFTSKTLKLLMAEGSLVTNAGNSHGIESIKASNLKHLRPNARAEYDLTSFVRNEITTSVSSLSSFIVYLEVSIGKISHTLEQKFDRIPWSKGEPLGLNEE